MGVKSTALAGLASISAFEPTTATVHVHPRRDGTAVVTVGLGQVLPRAEAEALARELELELDEDAIVEGHRP